MAEKVERGAFGAEQASRPATTARPTTPDGTVATDVTSPARPKSSASARLTASSTANGERKASGHVVLVIGDRVFEVRDQSIADLAAGRNDRKGGGIVGRAKAHRRAAQLGQMSLAP